MAKITLPPLPPKQAFGTAKTIDEQWQELYKSCSCTQERTWYVSCRIDKGMTPEQARKGEI